MGPRVPASHAVEARSCGCLYVRPVQERVKDNRVAPRRQAGDFLIADFIDRDAAPFCFRTLVAAALVHEPFQVGRGCGTAFDGQEQPGVGKERGHEQAGVNDRCFGNDLVDAPTARHQAGLIDMDRTGADRAGVDVEQSAHHRRARGKAGLLRCARGHPANDFTAVPEGLQGVVKVGQVVELHELA